MDVFSPVTEIKSSEPDTTYHRLLETGFLADAEIRLGTERTWKIHRLIVCHQSRYFKAALQGYFQEAATGVIKLESENWQEAQIECLLQFLYTETIDFARDFPTHAGTYPWHVLMSIWDVASYFQVDELVDLVRDAQSKHALSAAAALSCLDELQNQRELRSLTSALDSLYEPQGHYYKRPDVEQNFRPFLLSVTLCADPDTVGTLLTSKKYDNLWSGYESIVEAVAGRLWTLPTYPEDYDDYLSNGRTSHRGVPLEDHESFRTPFISMLPAIRARPCACDQCFVFPSLILWREMKKYKDGQRECQRLEKEVASAENHLTKVCYSLSRRRFRYV